MFIHSYLQTFMQALPTANVQYFIFYNSAYCVAVTSPKDTCILTMVNNLNKNITCLLQLQEAGHIFSKC